MKKMLCSRIAIILALGLLVLVPIVTTPPAPSPTPPSSVVPAAAFSAQETTSTLPATAASTTTVIQSQTTLAPAPTSTPEPKNITVTLASTGDLMCHLKNITAGYNTKTGSFDYTRFFRLVKPYLSQADFTLGNLETNLAEGDSPADFQGFPLFKSPDAFAVALKDAGFDLLTTANNHILDSGFSGLGRTLDVLDSLDLYHTGAARTEEEDEKPLVVDVNGIRFGFIAYTYPITISASTRTPSAMKAHALNMFELSKVKEDIKRAREAGAECVVVSLHWGPEENNTVTREPYKTAVKELLEAGADVILGHHPHVLQPMEWVSVTRENGQQVRCPVIYSQGNFHCNPATEGNAESCITYLTFEKDAVTGAVTCTDMAALPVYIYRIKTQPRDFLLIPIGQVLDDEDLYNKLNLDNRSVLTQGWKNILSSLGDEVRIIRK